MKIIKKLIRFTLMIIPSSIRLRLLYFIFIGKYPNFKNPRTFTEYINSLKLENINPLFSICADKVEVKNYVKDRIGPEFVIPTLYSGDKLPDIKERGWNIPYVIKMNHGCGWNIFIKNKLDCDWNNIDKKIKKWAETKYGTLFVENLYWKIKPQVLVEPYISMKEDFPVDYKFFCFNGLPEYVQVNTDRSTSHKVTFFDLKWNKTNMRLSGYPTDKNDIKKPLSFNKMINLASILSKDFKFVRVDFYEVEGKPLFGEMTFYPSSGLEKFYPSKWDVIFGNKILNKNI